jgi:RNase adapter protein RapZ
VSRVLYEHASSPGCRTVAWVLDRKRLDYDRVEVDEAVEGDLQRRHGTAELPLLEDGERAVAGMRPIAFYLERTAGSPSIFPADAQKRNQAVTLAEFAEQAIGTLLGSLERGDRPRDEALAELRALGARTRVLFLEASDDALIRRFDASRRPHPLADAERLLEGIQKERALLEELKGRADVVIDTSMLNVHELRDRLVGIFAADRTATSLQVDIVSFGFKHGLPLDADLVFDVRFLPNPHWVDELRPLDGRDEPVRDYVMHQDDAKAYLTELQRLFELTLPAYEREGKAYLSIAVGCTGGRHRSVAMAEALGGVHGELGYHPHIRHRDVGRE